MQRRQFIFTGAATALFAGIGCTPTSRSMSPVVHAPAGSMQGHNVDGVYRFLGIPYAEPPFGELRWRPPVRRQPWSGVLRTTNYGPICPQTGGLVSDDLIEGEDCLNLNVWTPDPGARDLPVMVWAHGGGQTSGTGANPLYDGGHFAREGVVLVTCNRRLGAEGFLYLEELFGEGVGPGNLGIQDLVMVLQWVSDNISVFGGDPNNITLFGESGGAAATQAVIATPGSKGLVAKAILQSGGHGVQRPDTATAIAEHVTQQLNVGKGDLDALRQVPWQQFVELYPDLESRTDWARPQIYLPVVNAHMPVHPVDAPHAGIGLDIDYLIGSCRDEANFFSAFMDLQGSQFERRARQVVAAAGASWDDVLARYAQLRPELDTEECFNAALGDMWFRLPSLRIAQGHQRNSKRNTYVYLFEWSSPLIGAAHALDLMVFGNGLALPFLGAFKGYEQTATMMRKAWVAFAASGSPQVQGQVWPPYDDKQATFSIDRSPSLLDQSYRQQFPLLEPVIQRNWLTAGL